MCRAVRCGDEGMREYGMPNGDGHPERSESRELYVRPEERETASGGRCFPRPFTNSPTHQLTNSPTHQLTNSPTHQLTNSPTHQLTNSPTHFSVLRYSTTSRISRR